MTIRRSLRHPSPVELSRAMIEGVDRRLDEHLRSCERCAAIWAEWTEVDMLVRRRPAPQVAGERSARVLAAVLEETRAADQSARGTRPLWIWGSLAGAAAAAAVAIVIGVRSTPPAEVPPSAIAQVYRGTVRAHEGARFERVSGVPDEVVRLFEGKVSVDVDPLREGERFRIVVGDGEVEVRGTSFDVVAVGDALESVLVDHGVVDVKPGSRPAVVLLDGQRWDARSSDGGEGEPTEATPPRALKELPARAAQPAPQAPSPPAPIPSAPSEPEVKHAAPSLPMAEHFDRGWTQLREGRFGEAARTFEEALAKYPSDPLAEDASFWRGVALARAKRSQDAARALAAFIDAYPTSPRAGEASVMLGWILLERGELDSAEARFRAAAADPVEKVRSSAAKGVETVHVTRANEATQR